MGADCLLLVLRALAFEDRVSSLFTIVDVIVDPLAVPNLVMTECQDACMGFGLLARRERIIKRKDTFRSDAFGLFARQLRFNHLFVHLPQSLVLADSRSNGKDLPQNQQYYEY